MESLSELRTCTETLPEGGRAFYSVFVLLFQFMLPMLTLSLAYYQVTINANGGGSVTKSIFLDLLHTAQSKSF